MKAARLCGPSLPVMSGAQTVTGRTHRCIKLFPKMPKRALVFRSSILPKLYEGWEDLYWRE
jgi:hypothetical protein